MFKNVYNIRLLSVCIMRYAETDKSRHTFLLWCSTVVRLFIFVDGHVLIEQNLEMLGQYHNSIN